MSEENHTPLPWKWHPEFRGNDRIGSIYAEHLQGHAYAVAMQPKYQTPERWDADATLIVRSVNAIPALLAAMEEIKRYSDENLGPSRSSLLSKISHTADTALATYRKE